MWTVQSGNYASLTDWEPMFSDPTAQWYLTTRNGEKILYIEADATNVEEALALGKEATDLSVAQASRGFRVLEMLANTKLVNPPDSIVRVFLADTRQKISPGGNKSLDLGEYVEQTKEADITIDATAPLLQEVMDWCEAVKPDPEAEEANGSKWKPGWFTEITGGNKEFKKTILFDTTNKDYHNVIAKTLSKVGYRIIDRGSIDPQASFHLPRLIYRETSADTISLFHTLITRRLADPSRCCIMIDSSRVVQELDYIGSQFQKFQPLEDDHDAPVAPRSATVQEGPIFKTICSAVIYDDLLRQVRIWTRMGYKPYEIQRELNQRFAPIFSLQKELEEEEDPIDIEED
uniref:Uncharacterized protein n=2 Tax=Lotharella globosa TaxID=91324 RepID=A0A7S3YBG2_9EUKA